MSFIDWSRARETARDVARRVDRGFALLGWVGLASFGANVAVFALGVDLLRRFCAMGEHQARQSDAALSRIAGYIHEVNPESAAQDVLLMVVVASVALTVCALLKVVQWFRHGTED